MMQRKTILVAPLNWGLGHATRCVPIINELIIHGFKVLIAGDGESLQLLQKEFPKLETITLPSYAISYPKNGLFFKIQMALSTPHILKTIKEEHMLMDSLIKEKNIKGIISDNRWGVRSKKVPSVFLTHQLIVRSGITSSLTSLIHQKLIKKFDECWVPDVGSHQNLSGMLGHVEMPNFKIKHIGTLSRLACRDLPKKYKVLILLSGPEPQRSLFEAQLIQEYETDFNAIFMVRGVVEKEQVFSQKGAIKMVNFLTTRELEEVINQSEIVVSRSGYSTIMDLAALKKKAFLVPTPGQYEQKYLAKRLQLKQMAPTCHQKVFKKEKLNDIDRYKGLSIEMETFDFGNLFRLFHSK